jgi:hypothetical protein
MKEKRAARDFSRRLRKGSGADASASGATRVSGTVNYKRKYEPDFPTVAILQAFPGRIVTPQQLHVLGLVAAPSSFILRLPQLTLLPALRGERSPESREHRPGHQPCGLLLGLDVRAARLEC